MSRKVEDLIPEMQYYAKEFAVKMAEIGLPFMFTCTFRSQEEQDTLFEQGRTTPGKIVTWTRNSKHIEGKAFDIAILKNGKPVWDLKVNVNMDELPDYEQAGRIGELVGLEWGGSWTKKDIPHFQLIGNI